jgi:hypothetical protein
MGSKIVEELADTDGKFVFKDRLPAGRVAGREGWSS